MIKKVTTRQKSRRIKARKNKTKTEENRVRTSSAAVGGTSRTTFHFTTAVVGLLPTKISRIRYEYRVHSKFHTDLRQTQSHPKSAVMEDFLSLARVPEVLSPVVTKLSVTRIHLDGRKQTSTR